MGDDSKTRPLGAGLARELGWDWLKGGVLLLFPTVTTAVTAISGAMRELPLWAIVAASVVTLAAALTTIRAAMDILQRVQIKGRLVLIGATALVHPGPNNVVDQLGVGLHILNRSGQTLEYKVISAQLVVGGRVNPSPTWKEYMGIIAPQVVNLFRVDMVPIPTMKAGKELIYTYEIEFAYGVPGNLKHTLTVNLKGVFKAKSATEIAHFEHMNA